jgi:hypothetical protein
MLLDQRKMDVRVLKALIKRFGLEAKWKKLSQL